MATDAPKLVEYLRRAYHAVDGLWFMMVERATDFEQALELDRQVWAVLAKVQARKAREVLGLAGHEPCDLARCLELKFTADGHRFDLHTDPEQVRVKVHGCPWLDLLEKSDRRHLAERVAQTICPLEGEVWCREFGDQYRFEMPRMACSGEEACEMRFIRQSPPAPGEKTPTGPTD